MVTFHAQCHVHFIEITATNVYAVDAQLLLLVLQLQQHVLVDAAFIARQFIENLIADLIVGCSGWHKLGNHSINGRTGNVRLLQDYLGMHRNI